MSSYWLYLIVGCRLQQSVEIGKARRKPCVQEGSPFITPTHSIISAANLTWEIDRSCAKRCFCSRWYNGGLRHRSHKTSSRKVGTAHPRTCGGNHTTGIMLTCTGQFKHTSQRDGVDKVGGTYMVPRVTTNVPA